MFELNDDILEQLKCSLCEDYLSCAPVLLKTDGTSICGRCPAPEEEDESMHNKPYETLAQFVIFPCQYKANGCKGKFKFGALKTHETACDFRQYVCPVMASGSCDWSGTRTEIYPHCQQEHPEKILEHPCVLEHDIKRNSLRTFITTAFNLIFLLHAKVCLQTRKIYHSVRLIGYYDEECLLKYRLDIDNGKSVLTRDGIVAPEGCLAIQENTAVATGINSLLEFLGGFKNTTFKITITNLIDCVQCCTQSTRSCFRTAEGWFCINCAPPGRRCHNGSQGCIYEDIETKTSKHEKIFCQFAKSCLLCKADVEGNMKQHYSTVHSDLTYELGTILCVDTTKDSNKQLLTINDTKSFLCMYTLKSSAFVFTIFSSLLSKDLYLHNCVLELSNPSTGHSVQRTLTVQYDRISDWNTIITDSEFQAVLHKKTFNIKIYFVNIADTSTQVGICKENATFYV